MRSLIVVIRVLVPRGKIVVITFPFTCTGLRRGIFDRWEPRIVILGVDRWGEGLGDHLRDDGEDGDGVGPHALKAC
jgi:hypothetical protein